MMPDDTITDNTNNKDKLPVKDFLSRHVPNQVTNSNKICYRHRPDLIKQRQPDDFNIETAQRQLEEVPTEDREAISHIWSIFSAAPADQRILILRGLVSTCCMPQLSFLHDAIKPLLRIDFLSVLPREVSLQIFFYLDAKSLCHAAQVSRNWKRLADDDALWHRMCEQHIDKKCTKCGWGLPLLNKKRRTIASLKRPLMIEPSEVPLRVSCGPSTSNTSVNSASSTNGNDSLASTNTTTVNDGNDAHNRPNKRSKIDKETTDIFEHTTAATKNTTDTHHFPNNTHSEEQALTICPSKPPPSRKPWKDVYSERLRVERNWRNNNYRLRTFSGHTDGVMCVQFCDSNAVMMTGSYDKTVRIWCLDTGKLVRVLTGHSRCVRALQFDEAKLVTGSMDHTLKIWNWQTGQCIRTLEGHTGGVLSLHFNSRMMASGSTDHTIRIWNFSAGECCTLAGHTEWVNSVRFCQEGTMLVSASDDSTIRLWDVQLRTCIRVFDGHVGQVQIAVPSHHGFTHRFNEEDALFQQQQPQQQHHQPSTSYLAAGHSSISSFQPGCASDSSASRRNSLSKAKTSSTATVTTGTLSKCPIIISGSLDNTIKIWDMNTGRCIRTLFGHVEGVWSLAYDTLRIVSSSHDKTVRVWDLGSGKCMYALEGHNGPVTSVALSDTKIISTSDDGDIKVWDYGISPTEATSTTAL